MSLFFFVYLILYFMIERLELSEDTHNERVFICIKASPWLSVLRRFDIQILKLQFQLSKCLELWAFLS